MHVLLQLNFYLFIGEYDIINEFPLYSQKLNPSHNNRGCIYTYNGIILSLKNPNKIFIALQ